MKDNSVNRYLIEGVLLLILLAVPIIVILNYQSSNRDEIEQFYAGKIKGILNLTSQTIQGKSKELETIKQQEISLLANRDWQKYQQIKKLLQSIVDERQIGQPFSTVHKQQIILNVLICHDFIDYKQLIQSEIIKQINWLNKHYGIGIKMGKQQKNNLSNYMQSNFIILIRQLKYQSIQQNIANKIKAGQYRNEYYLKQIAQELRKLPAFSHCKYTNIECQLKTILFIEHPQPKLSTYWEVDKELYFLDEINQTTIFNILSDVLPLNNYLQLQKQLGDGNISKKLYAQSHQRAYLINLHKNLLYIKHILTPSNFSLSTLWPKLQKEPQQAFKYLKNGQFITPYILNKNQRQYINHIITKAQRFFEYNERLELLVNPLTDSELGIIDLFPNDFKIGVYLPLFVIFLYPCFLKLKELLGYFVAILTKKTLLRQKKDN